jgi:hypothetical protein
MRLTVLVNIINPRATILSYLFKSFFIAPMAKKTGTTFGGTG